MTPRIDFTSASERFEDGMARICRLYGVSPLAGRLYALLFVSAGALSLDELVERSGAAKSSVSVALRKLLGMRVVRRLPPRSDRRDFYEAVADPWALLADWNRLFLQPELEMWRKSGRELTDALAGAKDAPKGEANAALRQRMQALSDFVELMAQLLSELSRGQLDRPAARAIAIDVEDGE